MSGFVEDALLQEIRDRNNIVSVIGDYVQLKKAGHQYKGLCPFHNERTPSFTVHEDRQFFYCFGCQSGGDVFSFVREMNGYSFSEAARHLADRVGIQIPERSRRNGPGDRPESKKRVSRNTRDALYQTTKDAQRFFTEAMQAMQGQRCRAYLRDRTISRESIERFGLGFAPEGWDGLEQFYRKRGGDTDIAVRAGLLGKKRSGDGCYDRFRNRLMFPVRNLAGEIIAYSGRTLSDDPAEAKYINSPETEVYTKGETLYGLYEARKALRNKAAAIVVEGNVDLVRLSQEGLEEVVAPMGTALTEAQCRLLKRFVPRVVLLYDGDRAGRAATFKAIPTALGEGLQVAAAFLPDGEDPDSYCKTHGADALRALIDQAQPGFTVLAEEILDATRAREDHRGKLNAVDQLAPLFDALSDQRERELCARQVAEEMDISEGQLMRFLRDAKRPRRGRINEGLQSTSPAHGQPLTGLPARECQLVVILLNHAEACALFLAHDMSDLITHADLRRLADTLASKWENEETVELSSFLSEHTTGPMKSRLYELLTEAPKEENWRSTFDQLVTSLKRDDIRRRSAKIDRELKRSKSAHDEGAELSALSLKLKLQREREDLQPH